MKKKQVSKKPRTPTPHLSEQNGGIPEGWGHCTLGELVTFQRGHDLPKSQVEDGPYPIAGSNGIIGYHKRFTTKGPGVTIGRSGNIGSPSYYDSDFWAHNTSLYAKEFHGSYPKFIYYLLKTLDLAGHNSGSAVPSLNRNYIHPVEVMVPKRIEVQKAITKILSDLDAKIELNHQMNKTLESIAQAIFKQWFVDFEFPGYEKTKFVNELPEGWREEKLGEFSDILNGHAFKSEDFVSSGIFLLRTRNFAESGYVVRDETACLPMSFYDEYKNFQLKKFDVLLVMVGASVGKMAIVQSSVLPALQNQNMWNFRSKSGVGQLFLNFLVKKIVQENLGTASGSARDFFRKDYFRSIDFILPKEAVLKSFDNNVGPIFELIDKNLREIEILTKIRDSLLPKLMSGKIRVK